MRSLLFMSANLQQHTQLSDSELYSCLGSGDSGSAQYALAEFYRRYSQRIYGYCRRIVGDNHAAEDLLQDAFMRLYESAKSNREIGHVSGYLFMIARNQCLNYRRKNNIKHTPIEDFHLSSHDSPYEDRELLNLITASLELLPDSYREAFVLREYNGMSYVEIQDIIGESMEVVKIRIFRAKQRLRAILAPYLSEYTHHI